MQAQLSRAFITCYATEADARAAIAALRPKTTLQAHIVQNMYGRYEVEMRGKREVKFLYSPLYQD